MICGIFNKKFELYEEYSRVKGELFQNFMFCYECYLLDLVDFTTLPLLAPAVGYKPAATPRPLLKVT